MPVKGLYSLSIRPYCRPWVLHFLQHCVLSHPLQNLFQQAWSGSDALTLNFAASETISRTQDRVLETQRGRRDPKNYEFSHPAPIVKYGIWPLGCQCSRWCDLQKHTLFKVGNRSENAHLHLTAAAQSTWTYKQTRHQAHNISTSQKHYNI